MLELCDSYRKADWIDEIEYPEFTSPSWKEKIDTAKPFFFQASTLILVSELN
jgi:hypothetical protein